MRASIFVMLLTVLSAACMVGEPGSALDRSDQHAAVVMSGAELDTELSSSPVHVAHEPFQRLGVMFDADRPTALELATSRDGVTWSAWRSIDLRNVEVDRTGSFVGELAIQDGPATRFKLRGTPGSVGYARIDVLGAIVEEWEGNDADENGDAFTTVAISLPGLTVRSRTDWNARRAGCKSTHSPQKMTIHHTDTPNADSLSVPARIRQMQNYHQNIRGWCDIGYHFLISPDGQIWEGRPISQLGAHTGGANTNNVGIALMGSFNKSPPPSAQLVATTNLVQAIGQRYKLTISRSTVKGHREQGTTATDCPGSTTFGLLGSIVKAANAGPQTAPEGDDPNDQPTTPPPATTLRIDGVIYEGTDPTARVAGATVTIGSKSATTSSTGTYSIDGIAPGSYTVTIQKTGYESATLTRQASAGTTISVGLSKVSSGTTAPTGTAVLQGVIYRGANGLDRIPYATVMLSTGTTVTTNASGYYLISGLPAGTVTVRATASGYTTNLVTRTLVNGQTEWGSVSLN
jgi:N-acetylmuramoyl-L-alanine amidase/Carboxypeptidase regulatory-like domain